MNTSIITDIDKYYESEIGYKIPPRTPIVGKNFNVTRAGIHADGLLKNEKIDNIFDTDLYLNRPVICAISNTSGLAGLAHWINATFMLNDQNEIDKKDPFIQELKEWVDELYMDGRVPVVTDEELFDKVRNIKGNYNLSLIRNED